MFWFIKILLMFLVIKFGYQYPYETSVVSIVLIFIFEAVTIFLYKITKMNTESLELYEQQVVEKYGAIYFLYPFASMGISKIYNLIKLFTYIAIPWLIYKGTYLSSIILAINYLYVKSKYWEVRFYPPYYLHLWDQANKKRGDYSPTALQLYTDMKWVDGIIDKMYGKVEG